jgi:hypothetical protein
MVRLPALLPDRARGLTEGGQNVEEGEPRGTSPDSFPGTVCAGLPGGAETAYSARQASTARPSALATNAPSACIESPSMMPWSCRLRARLRRPSRGPGVGSLAWPASSCAHPAVHLTSARPAPTAGSRATPTRAEPTAGLEPATPSLRVWGSRSGIAGPAATCVGGPASPSRNRLRPEQLGLVARARVQCPQFASTTKSRMPDGRDRAESSASPPRCSPGE